MQAVSKAGCSQHSRCSLSPIVDSRGSLVLVAVESVGALAFFGMHSEMYHQTATTCGLYTIGVVAVSSYMGCTHQYPAPVEAAAHGGISPPYLIAW